jgi:hypothetical protein
MKIQDMSSHEKSENILKPYQVKDTLEFLKKIGVIKIYEKDNQNHCILLHRLVCIGARRQKVQLFSSGIRRSEQEKGARYRVCGFAAPAPCTFISCTLSPVPFAFSLEPAVVCVCA